MISTVRQTVTVRYDPTPLRHALSTLGLTQVELAKERGVHPVTINRALTVSLPNSKEPGVSDDLVQWLCRRLGVPVGAVYQGIAE